MSRIIFMEYINPEQVDYVNNLNVHTAFELGVSMDPCMLEQNLLDNPENPAIIDVIKSIFAVNHEAIIILPVDVKLMAFIAKEIGTDKDVEMFCIVPSLDIMDDQMYFYGIDLPEDENTVVNIIKIHNQERIYNIATSLGIGAFKDIDPLKLIKANSAFEVNNDG